MAVPTFAVENAKDLRTALNFVDIYVSDLGNNGYPIFHWTTEELISVKLDLRCVDTKLDNPQLEGSSIEVRVYYDGDYSSLVSLMGTEAKIGYKAGYSGSTLYATNDADASPERMFYATLDKDSMQLKDHILTVKGTDLVGKTTGQDDGVLFTVYSTNTYNNVTYYSVSELLENYTRRILMPFSAYTSRITHGAKIWADKSTNNYDDNNRYVFLYKNSYRKLIANWMNIFRGSDPNNPDIIAKRFIFRDAGIPTAGWAPDAISAWPSLNYEPVMQTWSLSYDEIGDLEIEYGNSVKYVQVNNPRIDLSSQSLCQTPEMDIVGGTTQILTFSDPIQYNGFTITGSGVTVTSTILSPYAVKLAFSGTSRAKGYMTYRVISDLYLPGESEPNLEISTGISGETIKLEDTFGGLHKMNSRIGTSSYIGSATAVSNLSVVGRALEHTLNDCNLKRPKWITFTWRGNPHMQPRDMILFTEKNGTKNYYEIDNLTLEHKDGGLKSTIKAIYKCPYTN